MKRQNLVLSLLICIIIVLFVLDPKDNIDSCLDGIIVWATALLPALFPFFFFTRLLTELGFVKKISEYLEPITKKLYNAPGISAYVYTMSVLSGYPVGAKITSDLYDKNIISYGQACRITTFTSTSGPLFIIGTVGIGMFFDKTFGLIVLLSHFLSAIINGLFYRKYNLKNELDKSNTLAVKPISENVLEECMLNSIKSILIVGGYVSLFFMLITMLANYNLLTPFNYLIGKILTAFNMPYTLAPSITNGIIEITKGCLDLSKHGINKGIASIITSGIISFGGFSIHMQALTFLRKFKIKLKFYFLQKTTHAIISIIIAIPLAVLFL